MIIYSLGAAITFLIVVVARVAHRRPCDLREWAEIVVFAIVLACFWPIAMSCALYRDVRHPWS